MTNPYYNNTRDLVDYTRATASSVEQNFDDVTAGFDSVSAVLNRTLRGPAGETVAEMPLAVNRANKSLFFDASGNPQAAVAATSAQMDAAVAAADTCTTASAAAVAAAAEATGANAGASLIYLSLNYV